MRKRTLSLLIAGMFLFGTAAACGDDEPTTDDTEDNGGDNGGDDGGDEGGSGNAEVEAYCDDVEALAAQLEESGGDPAALAELTDELTALQTSASDLAANAAELTPEDSERLNECTTVLTDAAANLGG